MLFQIMWAALRRRPFSLAATLILLIVFSSLASAPVPVMLVVWTGAALLGLEVWSVAEPVALRLLGARVPTGAESTRLQSPAPFHGCPILIVDQPEPWVAPALRHLVVSRGMLDLVEDRALSALLSQATEQLRLGGLIGVPVVWFGNVELVAGFAVACCAVRLGELLASVIGYSLVLPQLWFPRHFRRYGGRVLGAIMLCLVGSTLIADGLPATGLALIVAWPAVGLLRALLNWESRWIEATADQATVAAGLGSHLHEALETLAWADELPRGHGLLQYLRQPGAKPVRRLQRIEQLLATS